MGKWYHGLEVLPYSKEPGKEFGQQEYSYCPFILLQEGGIVPLEDRFWSSLSICLQNGKRHSNKIVRKKKEIFRGNQYRKCFDYWWTLY